ncbi:MAG: hypothetical protein HYR68_13510, partial [Burkholderiales bacterium]|nr:hypothetical protein [Burkholderiales bacterium]
MRLATDDWGPIQAVSTSATRINKLQLDPEYARCYDNIGPQRIREVQSQTVLTICWPRNQDDLPAFEIWAVCEDGNRHEAIGTAAAIDGREFQYS